MGIAMAAQVSFYEYGKVSMTDDDQYPLRSPLCQSLTHDDKTIDIEIYEDGNGGWILEVVDEYGNSTVWDLPFQTDVEALAEVLRTIDEDGIEALIGLPAKPKRMNSRQIGQSLSDEELDELGDFLMSDATSDETMMIPCLDGFLTALVSGPVMVNPSIWLPRVWGNSAIDEPTFDTFAQAERIIGLIMRHMNGVIDSLQHDPETHDPLFDLTVYHDDPHEYVDGEMWAYGYMIGIDLQHTYWEPFLDDPASDEVLRPIYLLGADDVTEEEMALTTTPAQREELTKLIPASVARIYRFWQPYRRAVVERDIANHYQREHPKTGRNAPCPCGSGKKFKKCCGASTVLH